MSKEQKKLEEVQKAINFIRKQAEEYEKDVQNARYRNDEESALYYDGMRQGCLNTCLIIESKL